MYLTLLARFWFLIPLLILTATTGWYRHQAAQERDTRIQIQAEYKAFTAQVDAIGKAQEEHNRKVVNQQKEVSNAAAKSFQSRLDIINAEYSRLRDDKANSGQRSLPPDATAPKPTTDPARDAELLAILRQAEIQTGQLIELQGWVRALPR